MQLLPRAYMDKIDSHFARIPLFNTTRLHAAVKREIGKSPLSSAAEKQSMQQPEIA